jgi:purine-binding chemotaxis protein CheW
MAQQTTLDTHANGAPHESTSLAVTFAIGPQVYGLPVTEVLEIVRLPSLLMLAGAPAYLCGLLNRRGRQLPVLDGRVLMDEPPHYHLNTQIVIAGHASGGAQAVPLMGLLVDEVRDVRAFQTSRLTPLNTATSAPFLRGVVDWDDRSALMLDLDALLALVPSAQLQGSP